MSEEENIEKQSTEISSQPTDNNDNVSEAPINNEQASTENMEIHKHPHHITHKKKWAEYVL
jgi:hypothetical protein